MEEGAITSIDVPLSIVTPAKLNKQASAESCGLFFPYGTRLPMGLAIDWSGETHLIHLDGKYAYQETGLDVGQSIAGAIINQIEYRVDINSLYDPSKEWDAAGSLIVKDGELFMCCHTLGYEFHDDTHQVPVGNGYLGGRGSEASGFKRWSIAIADGGRPKVLRSFEALSKR